MQILTSLAPGPPSPPNPQCRSQYQVPSDTPPRPSRFLKATEATEPATVPDSLSAVKKARTDITAALDFAVDEQLIARNPGRKLELPSKRLQALWALLLTR